MMSFKDFRIKNLEKEVKDLRKRICELEAELDQYRNPTTQEETKDKVDINEISLVNYIKSPIENNVCLSIEELYQIFLTFKNKWSSFSKHITSVSINTEKKRLSFDLTIPFIDITEYKLFKDSEPKRIEINDANFRTKLMTACVSITEPIHGILLKKLDPIEQRSSILQLTTEDNHFLKFTVDENKEYFVGDLIAELFGEIFYWPKKMLLRSDVFITFSSYSYRLLVNTFIPVECELIPEIKYIILNYDVVQWGPMFLLASLNPKDTYTLKVEFANSDKCKIDSNIINSIEYECKDTIYI